MSQFDYDLFVIGAGSGGVRAARIAGGHGAKVAIAEEYRVGGTCVIRGCVPKKLFVYASHFADELEDAAGFGWTVEGARFDWATLRDNVQKEVSRLQGLYGQTLGNAGVTVYNARARFIDPHTLDVGGERVTARKILVATGAAPVTPDFPGAELGFTSNEAFHLEQLPKRILVYGGGYIATEFAGIFHGLGVEVTQAFRASTILRGWDEELRARLQEIYAQKGIHMRGGASIARLDKAEGENGDIIRATMTDGEVIETDAVMYAIGRKPNVEGLGLEAAGVKTAENGAIVVSADSQTSCAHIYAVGDVTDRIQLTPVAIKEGHAFSDTVFGGKHWKADHRLVPSAVFSQPPLASVGLDEDTARNEGHEIRVFRSDFRPMKFTLSGRQERTLCKLVVDANTDRVLGAHMLGPDAPEIIQAIAIAVKLGATKAQFDQTVAVHPTAAEEFVLMR